VRAYFERIGFAAVSQKPIFTTIMERLYKQLTGEALPETAAGDEGLSFDALRECAKGRLWLVCCDDVWSSDVEQRLNFLDDSTSSKMLVVSNLACSLCLSVDVRLLAVDPNQRACRGRQRNSVSPAQPARSDRYVVQRGRA
jgi:hypothetical protein